MAVYKTLTLSPLKLMLDTQNPRFIIPPNATQIDARNYLLEYEGVVNLAKGINGFGGLMPGERIIVCKENNSYVVLEGNRRVCACQLLIDPSLVPGNFLTKFPTVNQTVIDNISKITVDVTDSRKDTQTVLAERHIEGPRRWSPISKKKFFASYFDEGNSIDFISQMTGAKKSEVLKDVKDYHLILYALNLPYWTEEEKNTNLNLISIKIDPFLRLFSARSKKLQINATELLKLDYNDRTLQPFSLLGKDLFNQCIYLIAKAVFIDKVVDTRKSIEDVPDLLEFIESNPVPSIIVNVSSENKSPGSNQVSSNNEIVPTNEDQITQTSVEVNQISFLDDEPAQLDKNSKVESTDVPLQNKPNEENSEKADSSLNPSNILVPPQVTSPKPARFFANLTWSKVDNLNPENTGLIAYADEIQRLSQYNHYGKYPISTAMLLRSLIEHTLKYYAREKNLWTKIKTNPKDNDPKLEVIIKYYVTNSTNIFQDKDVRRLFDVIFNNSGLKSCLDLVVHQPQSSRPTKEILDTVADIGLFSFINNILNS
jgi:hypothetical protein